MKIEYYTSEDEIIPINHKLKIDDKYIVYYSRVSIEKLDYIFTVIFDPKDDKPVADQIIDEIIKVMIEQSSKIGTAWVETKREFSGTLTVSNKNHYHYNVSFDFAVPKD